MTGWDAKIGVEPTSSSTRAPASADASGVMKSVEAGSRSQLFLMVGLAVLGLVGTALVWYATRLGAGLTDDSYYYIAPAQQWLAGDGLHPSPLFPPLLPVLVALLSLPGLEPMLTIRLLNAVLFGVMIVLSGWVVWSTTRSVGFALLAGGLTLSIEALFEVHAWAMSEPLYLVLTLLCLIALDAYLRGQRSAAFWAAVVLAALGALTRYIGVCLVGAVALALLLWPGRSTARRWGDALLAGVLGLAPVIAYVLRNHFGQGSAFGARAYAWGPYEAHYTRGALNSLLSWLVPGRLVNGREEWVLAGVLGLAAAAAAWYFFARRGLARQALADGLRRPLPWLLAALIGLTLLVLFVLLFTRGIIASGESYSIRYLAPVFLAALLLLVWALQKLWQAGSRLQRLAIGGVCVILLFSAMYRTADRAGQLAIQGAGYASERWHVSETVAYLNNNPERPVVSTANFGIYFWTGRLPRSIGSFSSPAELHAYLREAQAYLVIIDSMPPEMYGWQSDQLVAGLTLYQQFSEGAVYTAEP